MVNMEFVHGLERALELIDSSINENRARMKDYADKYREFATEHKDDVFYLQFMNKYFPDVKRLKVMDIVRMWKIVYAKTTRAEIQELLEETEEWKVTNVHGTLWATKI